MAAEQRAARLAEMRAAAEIPVVALRLARGTLVHLAEVAGTTTLCGRTHGQNPIHVHAGGAYVQAPDQATCTKCLALQPQMKVANNGI